MKLIVAGSRDFQDYDILCRELDLICNRYGIHEIVSGGARGADTLGEAYATKQKIKIVQFIPDWKLLGRDVAGIIRNEQMGDYADMLVAFWNGHSAGTRHMIQYMQRLNKPTFVHLPTLERYQQ